MLHARGAAGQLAGKRGDHFHVGAVATWAFFRGGGFNPTFLNEPTQRSLDVQ